MRIDKEKKVDVMESLPSPVVIFTYLKLDTLKKTIASLKVNIGADKTNIIIFSDSWKSLNDKKAVKRVREYLYTITGFKTCTIVERKANFGLARNIIEGVTEIIKENGAVIVLEDDLLTSNNFLCYMNSSLNHYENEKKIFSISGFTLSLPSLADDKYDTYLSYRPSSWGWATWKDQWENIDWKVTDFESFIKNKKEIKKFNRGGVDMTRMLKQHIEGKNNSWAIRWSYAMNKNNSFCVYPKVSKIQNIGFGKTATHCSGINIYKTTLDNSSQCNFNFTDKKEPNKLIVKEFRHQYSYTSKLIKKIKSIFNGV